jgi:hypothetical protein
MNDSKLRWGRDLLLSDRKIPLLGGMITQSGFLVGACEASSLNEKHTAEHCTTVLAR